jgi:uncharacterized protein YndB with AHSA1/START domain
MALVKSSFVVGAPPERVFDFIAYPPNFRRMWPAMVNVFDLRPSARGGLDWRWAYRMLGLKLEGNTVVLEFDPPKQIVMRSEGGGLVVSHTWTLEPFGVGTRLTVAMDFKLPAQWLTGLAEPLLVRENRQQVAIAMRNLRQALEADPRAA